MGLLHWSVPHGHVAIVNILLKSGIRIDAVDTYARTALHFACDLSIDFLSIVDNDGAERASIISKLVHWGANVNKQSKDGSTPLHLCGQHNFIDGAMKLLMDGKAKMDICDGNNKTPLCVALDKEHLDLAELFAKTGATLMKSPTASQGLFSKGQMNVKSYLKYLQSVQSATNYSIIERLEEMLIAKDRGIEQLKDSLNMLLTQFNSFMDSQFNANRIMQDEINKRGFWREQERPNKILISEEVEVKIE